MSSKFWSRGKSSQLSSQRPGFNPNLPETSEQPWRNVVPCFRTWNGGDTALKHHGYGSDWYRYVSGVLDRFQGKVDTFQHKRDTFQ